MSGEERDALVDSLPLAGTGDEAAEPEEDAPYDAGDRRAVKQRQLVLKRLDAAHRMVLRQIMGSKEGRSWMYQTLTQCHVFQTSFSHSSLDMAYSEGERNIGLRLINDVVAACPERYMEMMKEANSDE